MNITRENIRTYTDRMRSAMPSTAALSHAQALQVFCRTLYNRSYEECLASNFSLGSPLTPTQVTEPVATVRKKVKKSDWMISYQEYQKLLNDLASATWSELNDRKYTCTFGELTYVLDRGVPERHKYGTDIVNRITIYDGKEYLGKVQEQVRPNTLCVSWFQDDNAFVEEPLLAEILSAFPGISAECTAQQKEFSETDTIHLEIQNCGNFIKEVSDWCDVHIQAQAKKQKTYAWIESRTGELGLPRRAEAEFQQLVRTVVRKFHPLAWFPGEKS